MVSQKQRTLRHWTEVVDPQIVEFIKTTHPGVHPDQVQVLGWTRVIIHNTRSWRVRPNLKRATRKSQ